MSTNWTRDDLPEMRWLHQTFLDGPSAGVEAGFEDLAVALIDHLNAHHPKPDATRIRNLEWEVAEHSSGARRAVNERDRMRRERDAAVERAEAAEREVNTWRTSTESAHSDFLQAAHDRDLWKDSAEYAAGERDEWMSRAEQAEADLSAARARAEVAESAYRKLSGGEDPASAVSRADIEKAIHGAFPGWSTTRETRISEATDAVCDLLGVEAEQAVDPVEDKARELYALAHPGVFVPKGDDAELAPFRRLAAHQLGPRRTSE